MKPRIFAVLLAGVLAPPFGAAAEPAVAEESTAETSIPWADGLPEALATAAKEKKPVLVDFEAEWCGWCKKLDRETYGDERVIRFVREHFIAVKVDTDKEPETGEKYSVRGLPTILFLSPDGVELLRLSGFRTPDVFLREAGKPAESAAKLADLKKAAEDAPADLPAQRAYARALHLAGSTQAAVSVLRRALETTPNDPGLLLDLADLLRAAKELGEARKVYEQILQAPAGTADEEQAQAYLPLGRILVSLKKPAEALLVLDAFLEKGHDKDELVEALFLRGYAHAVLKDAASALEDLRLAQKTDPDGPWGLRAAYIVELLESP